MCSSMSKRKQRAPRRGFGNEMPYHGVMLKDSLHFAYLTLLLYGFIPINLQHQQAQPATIRALIPTSTVHADSETLGFPIHLVGAPLCTQQKDHSAVAFLPHHQELTLNTDPLPISSKLMSCQMAVSHLP